MDTGLSDECVDAVLLHDVIHLIDERAALFGEMYRVLKPDGLVSMYPMHVDNDEVYLLNNWGKPAQAPVSGAFSPRNIEMIR